MATFWEMESRSSIVWCWAILVTITNEDHLSGLKGAAFWTHFARPDCIKLPIIYYEKVQDRLAAAARKYLAHIEGAQTRTHRAMLAKRERDLNRMVRCCEATLLDHSKSTLLETPDIGEGNESKAKVYEYGNTEMSKSRTKKDPSNKKAMNPRVCITTLLRPSAFSSLTRVPSLLPHSQVCVDCFLFRAIEHWIRLEERATRTLFIQTSSRGILMATEGYRYASTQAAKQT